MGEYEPNDSRDVTLNDKTAPGEPERTGPRENEAREQASREKPRPDRISSDKIRSERDGPEPDADPEPLPQTQQLSRQAQDHARAVENGGTSRSPGQSQAQSQAQSHAQSQPQSLSLGAQPQARPDMLDAGTLALGDPDRQEMQAEPDGPPAGNQPQAIDNPAGAAEPQYDQYEPNQPQNMHQQGAEHETRVREQASRQKDRISTGDSVDAGEEVGEAVDAARGYGGLGAAEKEAYDRR